MARRGFIRTIILVVIAGFIVVLAVSVTLVAIDRLNWWRFWLNIGGYLLMAGLLGSFAYHEGIKTWLRGHAAGRVLSINEIVSDAVYSMDSSTIITTWSKGAERLLGYTEEEAIGESCVLVLPDDFFEREVSMLQQLYEDGIVTHHLTFNRRKGGEVFPAESSLTLLREPDGTPGGILVVIRDRTQQVQIEEELRRIRDEMEAMTAPGAPSVAGDERVHELEEVREAASATVSALAAVAERRDPYTAGHQRRVSQLATAIAREMGLDEHQVEGVRVAGILHDTGKVVIPGEILSKPTRLSEFEFGIVRTHPKVDAEILAGVSFPWPIATAVLQHHERLDGSGYPSGLDADEIITEARILAVADVVEAMSSHRPYRPAVGIDKALEEVSRFRGTRYDAEVVDACLRLFKDKQFALT